MERVRTENRNPYHIIFPAGEQVRLFRLDFYLFFLYHTEKEPIRREES